MMDKLSKKEADEKLDGRDGSVRIWESIAKGKSVEEIIELNNKLTETLQEFEERHNCELQVLITRWDKWIKR